VLLEEQDNKVQLQVVFGPEQPLEVFLDIYLVQESMYSS
jgi:hypothetical protein